MKTASAISRLSRTPSPWHARLGHAIADCATLLLLLGATPALAVDPMPPAMRFEARIERTLSAPADHPLTMPTAVAVDSTGCVFVADGVNDRIARFKPDGTFDTDITTIGDAQLSRPVGLAVDSADQLWIADTGKHRIVVARPDGTLAQTIALPESGKGHTADPTGLAITPDGRRTYIVDNDNHRLFVRDNQTSLFVSLGSLGRALGQFEYPFAVCLGQDGYAFITEAAGARVQTISPEDRWAGQIGAWGIELGQLYRPKGIAADRDERVFVSDSTLSVVQVFSPRGTIQGILTDSNGMPLRFDHPMGICFDKHGSLYVVELRANRVTVLSVTQPPRLTDNRSDIRVRPDPSSSPATLPTTRSRPRCAAAV